MVAAVSRPPIEHSHGLHTLLSGGDWACANLQAGTLAEVARLLGPCVSAPDQIELDEIAALAATDMANASGRWSRLSTRLRSRLAASDGR